MELYNSENVLVCELDSKVDYKITSAFDNLVLYLKGRTFQIIEIDFNKTKFITLPGAMYLLFIIYYIVNTRQQNGSYVETRIKGYSESTISALANFGLIEMLKIYGNLKSDENVERKSIDRLRFWKKSIKEFDYDLANLYWPISIIPLKSGSDFESEVYSFFNNFIDYFNLLSKYEMIADLEIEKIEFVRNYFIKSINESTKNVWDHSESWGAASIQSNRRNKTTFCLFDYGVGFINSYIKRKGSYIRSAERDKEILQWLFKEGNTSNEENNHGHGLAIIAKFVDFTNGVLLIRTDKYFLQYSKEKKLNITETNYFPGTQIMINF